MKIVAITGGTGFVGRAVVAEFLRSGYRVRALVRNESSKAKLPAHQNLVCITGDPCVADDVLKALDGADTLVHLVGIRLKEARKTGKNYEDIDVGSAIASIEAIKRSSTRRILILTAADIGNSFYVRCKRRVETLVKEAGLDWTIFRPSFIVGPSQEWPVILTPFLWAFGYFPGYVGRKTRLAQNIRLEALAKAFVAAFRDDNTIRKSLDVTDIRQMWKS
jgi:2-alkyl-3-oxoalkanoate reductase